MIRELGKQIKSNQIWLRPMVTPTDATNQTRVIFINWIQCPGKTIFACLARPNEITLRLDRIKHPASGSADRNFIADLYILQFRYDALCTVSLAFAACIFDDVIAIVPSAVKSHLYQPGPDFMRRPFDRDGPRSEKCGMRIQFISGHGPLYFLLCRAPLQLIRTCP